ncbi:hypothetical protein FPV67DRAFT_1545907 [Lyophyllum atratum]|nr:hypothetical protein FPV67DRAFT_1545907 [Lyophyllum atratum]
MFESNALMAWLATSIVCDLMIIVTLSVQLWIKKQKTFHFVNHVVHRGMRMAIETGGLTCGVAIAELVLFLTPQSSYLHMLVIISGKIYSNSLLASLNSRAPIFRKDDPADEEVWEVNHASIAFRRTTTTRTMTHTGVCSEV